MKPFLFTALAFLFVKGYFLFTDDFREAALFQRKDFSQEWKSVVPNDETLKMYFQQSFSYLGKGAQCYAFLSEDGTVVLKFFKKKHLVPSFFDRWYPLQAKMEKRFKKQKVLFQGYELAMEKNQKESGLIAVSLNSQRRFSLFVSVKDKLGLNWTINLDEVAFVLQEKATSLRETLIHHLKRGEVSAAVKKIERVYDHYYGEYQKGIVDSDHGFTHNVGFIDDRVVHFDVGKMRSDPAIRDPLRIKQEFLSLSSRLKRWIAKNFPDQLEEISSAIDKKVASLS